MTTARCQIAELPSDADDTADIIACRAYVERAEMREARVLMI